VAGLEYLNTVEVRYKDFWLESFTFPEKGSSQNGDSCQINKKNYKVCNSHKLRLKIAA